MDVSGYLKRFDKIKFSEETCPSCNSAVLYAGPAGAFCHFCEMYTPIDSKRKMDDSAAAAFTAAHAATIKGDTMSATSAMAPLEASADPLVLYGVGNVYMALSDYTYHGVNYALGGFMYSNADKRNDEYNKNPANSMHLLSKAKEMMYASIFTINKAAKGDDWLYLYTKFISEIKLKRLALAHLLLNELNKQRQTPVNSYSNLSYTIWTGGKNAEKLLRPLLDTGEINAYYYLAKYLAGRNDLLGAQKVLTKISSRTRMPMADNLMLKAKEISAATAL